MTSFCPAMAFWIRSITVASVMAQRRCVTLYSSFSSTAGGVRPDLLQHCVDFLLRIVIEHEEQAGLHVGLAQQFEAVGFWACESVLVAEDHAGFVIF